MVTVIIVIVQQLAFVVTKVTGQFDEPGRVQGGNWQTCRREVGGVGLVGLGR